MKAFKKFEPFMIGILFLGFVCMLSTDDAQSDHVAETSTESIEETEQTGSAGDQTEETGETETSSEEAENEIPAATEDVPETENTEIAAQTEPSTEIILSLAEIPEYAGSPYVEINDNVPQFPETDLSTVSYEYYSELDSLGRCGVAYACIGKDLMPTEERGEIGSVKPAGWHTVKYDVVDGKYLYNRCHLIAYQLSGENANVNNLMTGTRYLNMEGMVPFENMVADYVAETGNHVMYRVSPIYEGDDLLANGVQMEAKSVEDDGEGILFNVYCYNVQPGVTIDYATGDSKPADDVATEETSGVSDKTVNADSQSDSSDSNSKSDSNTGSDSNSQSNGSSGDNAAGNSDSTGSVSDTSGDATSLPNSTGGSAAMVWKSATGSKYHSINNCGKMNPSKATQITEEQAINQGLEKCSKCW